MREEEAKRIATIFLSDFYYGCDEIERVCQEHGWEEEDFTREVNRCFYDLLK